jgi:hypothetical protein
MFAPDAQQWLCVTQFGETAVQNETQRSGVGGRNAGFVGGIQHTGDVADMKKYAG